MTAARGCLAAALLLFATHTGAGSRAFIAIIIDDLGYQLEAGRRAISLPGSLAFGVIPGSPRATTLARHAHENGKEVLVHLPLQANSEEATQDPVSIELDMSRERVGTVFEKALESVPHAVGVNGHRGSLLTRHPGHMQWLMEEISARENLFFVDSYTTHHSIALQMAAEAGVDAIRRDVFLDPERSPETVEWEFARMKRLALRRGKVVAIGHPYPATLDLLERELPQLEREGFELVRVSELVR